MTANKPLRTRDGGFTLTELLIVIAMIGIISVTIGAVFSVIVRTNPTTEARTDDSRSLLSLTNWISQDVTSTAEDGFAVGNVATACLSTSVPTSTGLLQLRWSEGTSNYVVNYRYVSDGVGTNTGTIYRYSCRSGQSASALKLTPQLRDLSTAALAPAPARITLIPTTMASGAAGNKGLQFEVFVLDEFGVQRELLSLDATTSNVAGILPPISGGGGSTNQPPQANQGTTSAVAGSLTTYVLPAYDPEGAALTTTFTGVPLSWVVPSSSSVTASITPDPTAVGIYVMNYIVTDPIAPNATATNTLTVTVSQPVVNQPPIANSVSRNASAGDPVTVRLPASDPEAGVLTIVSVTGLPNNWTGPTFSGLDVMLTPHSGAAGTYTFPYTVRDPAGATASSTLTINICSATIQSVIPSSVVVNPNGSLATLVTVTISHNGFCDPLVLGFLPSASQAVESPEPFNGGTSVELGATEYVWTVPSGSGNAVKKRAVTLNLRQRANGPIEDTDSLETKDR